nr:PREDICTED: zinc finger protein 507 isoform X2 [Latimeria chalumnae]|eukprot:XP_014345338.1 PREDICTED: zinc finger protein 507 isoform X2 [Latimeria chalumnae]
MEEGRSIAVLVPHLDGQEAVLISDNTVDSQLQNSNSQQKHKRTDSLIQVIQKLSKIVENENSRRCPVVGKKRNSDPANPALKIESKGSHEVKTQVIKSALGPMKVKEEAAITQTDNFGTDCVPLTPNRKITCYQCSLCKFISQSFMQLQEHLKHHGRQNDVVLMCSECCFVSRKQEELESHVRTHLENGDLQKQHIEPKSLHQEHLNLSTVARLDQVEGNSPVPCLQVNLESKDSSWSLFGSQDESRKRKWYKYEQYGLYRCLICSYTCGQQRMLKTHAWKHAGEVDCSYPIFEEENGPASLLDSTMEHTSPTDEMAVMLSTEDKPLDSHSTGQIQLQLCNTDHMVCKSSLKETDMKSAEVLKHSKAPTPTAEVVVEEENLSDPEHDSLMTDSLLSSAQKIISCSPNNTGHVNVIVERLPSVEETVSQKPFLINPDIEVEKRLISEVSHMAYDEEPSDTYCVDKSVQKDEVGTGWRSKEKEDDVKSDEPVTVDENVPPVRKRTDSESLRLHSLAAEALVTMPIRAIELTRINYNSITELGTPELDTGQRHTDVSSSSQCKVVSSNSCTEDLVSVKQSNASCVDLELQQDKPDLTEVPVKMGISMSLLTVIEKLKERTDQNASDEDILKELQDNAQCYPSSDTGSGLPGGSLVDYIPNVERPYQCRLCHYSSGNKGYIKQHLRVHRQRQPYQCPICDHIAEDSKDLENHMINHCKTRTYHCKQCDESFHYKSQLRNHEREQHSVRDVLSTVTSNENTGIVGEQEKSVQGDESSVQKVYKCDVCEYTSSTYVGVRNHRRIHNSDKPYRCSSCDFATTNMNSLKCHMKRHPQEHQAVQLLEQYKCSLCGYMCSHPPSLKSHMWKHASDQNYNYEQVNKAINDAISQSSRLQGQPEINIPVETTDEKSQPGFGSSETAVSFSEIVTETAIEPVVPNKIQKLSSLRHSIVDPEKCTGQPRAGMEYCVLLFCCCICGFESTSKEHLMEHMKEHEGEIINIILNKDHSSPAVQNSTT